MSHAPCPGERPYDVEFLIATRRELIAFLGFPRLFCTRNYAERTRELLIIQRQIERIERDDD